MKRFIVITLSSISTLLLGAFLLIPLNEWLWELRGLEGGYDDEMKMFDIVFFIEWPLLLILGGFIGNFIYKKYLTKSSS